MFGLGVNGQIDNMIGFNDKLLVLLLQLVLLHFEEVLEGKVDRSAGKRIHFWLVLHLGLTFLAFLLFSYSSVVEWFSNEVRNQTLVLNSRCWSVHPTNSDPGSLAV